jgi:hypothetical protein
VEGFWQSKRLGSNVILPKTSYLETSEVLSSSKFGSTEYGERSAFLPWIEILTDIISDKDPEGKPIASKLLAVVKDTLGPWMGVVPVVGSIIAAVWETGKKCQNAFRGQG